MRNLQVIALMGILWSAVGWTSLQAAEREILVGGRIMNDWLLVSEGQRVEAAFGPLETGTEFRRARLFARGMLVGRTEFKIQFDFAGGKISFKDVYLGLRDVPLLGSIRVGHQKEPFSLEELTSSKYITFMERALPNIFAPARNTGLRFQGTGLGGRMTWSAGVFRDASGTGNSVNSGGWSFTARVTGLPWFQDEGQRLLHLGVAYSYRDPVGGVIRFHARPEVHLAPRLVDTGTMIADTVRLLGLEGAWVFGPLSIQGEYLTALLEIPHGTNLQFHGYYMYISFIITGERRPYRVSEGAFTRLKPRWNFLDGRGLGAWEVGIRYSVLDLNEQGIRGGVLRNLTVGVNWYLNAYARIMLNFVRSNRTDVGASHYFMMRFQVDF